MRSVLFGAILANAGERMLPPGPAWGDEAMSNSQLIARKELEEACETEERKTGLKD